MGSTSATFTAVKETDTNMPKDPLEGMTLEAILTVLVEHYGWEEMGSAVPINCFLKDPSVSSSLKFLRRTPWARKKVEELYLNYLWEKKQNP